MDARTRRIIAFVAASAGSERDVRSIVEVESGLTTQFQGEVEPDRVALFDVDDGAVISGMGEGRALHLSDSLTGVDVKLWIQGDRFYGWILTSDQPFFGRVRDNEIVVRHPGDVKAYRFLV